LEWSAEHKIQAIQGTIQDVTDRVKAEEKIQYLSRYDRLTGLPNRDSFAAALESMAHYCVHGQRNGVIILIDLDHFVRVNDLYGHHIGDYVLVESGRRVKQFLQEMTQQVHNIKGECCRWGGDKFAISLCCSEGERDYAHVASALLALLSEPYHIHDYRVHLTACLGYVAVEGGLDDIESLVRSAENALRFAKRQGANVLRCYDSTMSESTERRMTLEAELRKALAEQQLRVVYQPRVNAATQKICGAEALLRWNHPLIGEVSPVEFIPIMEELGIIQEVGAWVFEEACKQLKAWYQQGHTEFVMSINLSAVQFRDVTLPTQIQAIISRIEVSPELVEVELTETAIMDDVGKTQRMLFALKELGVRVAIDDFGTGHSSLSYLRSFPIDTLKVDRSFIRELPGSAEDSSLAAAIISMARSLDLRVVAEGVEYRGQADFLLEKQCDELQGFLFSKPVSPAFFSTLLETFNKD
jgi:diguanylate cyclase (GGDEF)-like protein